MVSLITPAKAQKMLAENMRLHRLQMELTQEGLAKWSELANEYGVMATNLKLITKKLAELSN